MRNSLMINKKLLLDFLVFLSCFLLLWIFCNVFFLNGDLGICNVLCMSVSAIMIFVGMNLLSNIGPKCYIIFICIYFGTLLLNTLNISGYQTAKDIVDIYYIMVGGFVFTFWLYLGEKIKLKKKYIKKMKIFNLKGIIIVSFAFYIFITAYTFYKNGIPLLGGAYSSDALNKYKEAGITGLGVILGYVSIIASSECEKKYRFIIYAAVTFTEGVLKFSRGNLFRLIVFFGILIIVKKDIHYNEKFVKKIVPFLLIFVLFFGGLGNLRSNIRGEIVKDNATIWINELVNTNVNIGNIAWVYGYTSVNFDTLKMVYYQKKNYDLATFMAPFERLVKGSDAISSYNEMQTIDLTRTDTKFSVNTMKIFLAPYIKDMGYLFFIELSLVGILYMFFIFFSRNTKHVGLYSYITMLVSLTICGNYIFSSTYLYVIIAVVILFLVKDDKNVGLPHNVRTQSQGN